MRNTEHKNRQKHKATFLEKARRRQRAEYHRRKEEDKLREDYAA
ncbi:hypothetical protein [Vibrio phage JSF23]|jgi:hypothetical protein|uniref:Uncharacterized protein n=3 Tax=Icepovirus bengalense TaxID=2846603 RepID=A0A076GB99_9CAUD|nr:hypothetical protein ViPhICP2p61 [Vibrio phage ICP2]AII27104.1 hypothetical protein ICP22011A_0060 [Vibrio phage ICP2_2011_A]ASV43757.1 hypothetical protein [Vibrio phage JSF23]ASV43853.1 hypothetical protein [Vibrio phage JSF27]WJJ54330.1 hypothetical protein [Vibrio phage JPW]ADX87743.1 hypothetical protein [Vibrio phage ICP2]